MAEGKFKITTPPGIAAGSVRLRWNPAFGPKLTAAFARAQLYVDTEVLRFCAARVPRGTGALEASGTRATRCGSGKVRYDAPYAAQQYYSTGPMRKYDALRGGRWFERGKIDERERILRSTAAMLGGKVK